jgi:hypothetical protein
MFMSKALLGCTSVLAVATVNDPLSAYKEMGLPGLLIIFLVALWLDNKRQEKKADDRDERFLKALENLSLKFSDLKDWCRNKHQ